jgi:hypothetical protein
MAGAGSRAQPVTRRPRRPETSMFKHLIAIVLGSSTLVHAASTSGQCLHFEKSEREKTIIYAVESSCEKKQTCSISWEVQCEDEKGAISDRSYKTKRFILDRDGKASIELSAESCKQAWRIDDVNYKCDDVK